MMKKHEIETCWCGSSELEKYTENYVRCRNCSTLINTPRFEDGFFRVEDEETAYYGKNYWLEHQTNELGLKSILERAREDLSGRCIYWLETALKYISPGDRTLEVGFGSGGLIALLSELGFESHGIELSEWLVQYVNSIYGIDVKKDIIENFVAPSKSFDSIFLFDVMEHFSNPLSTVEAISRLIKDDGYLFIQTPCFQNYDKSIDELIKINDPFLQMIIDKEHLYLYSEDSLKKLLKKFGFNFFYVEKALFPYDMFIVATKNGIKRNSLSEAKKKCEQTRQGRVMLALMDVYDKLREIENLLEESEIDRNARLQEIINLNKRLQESEIDRANRLEIISKLEDLLRESELDRANRLTVIQELNDQLRKSEKDKTDYLNKVDGITKEFANVQAQLKSLRKIINANWIIKKYIEFKE